MIGILVELLLSWVLLKYIGHTGFGALGFLPNRKRLLQLLVGLLLTIGFTALLQMVVSALTQNPYQLNPHYKSKYFLQGCGYVFRSVMYENLIFNGALLYLLTKRIGPVRAAVISGVCFGIYHWFSWSLFGNPAQMLIVFLMTGSGGYVFAMAFLRTGSVYLPAALHFGLDFASMIIFSGDKQMGAQLFIKTFSVAPVSPNSLISLIVIILFYTWFPLSGILYFHVVNKHPGKKNR